MGPKKNPTKNQNTLSNFFECAMPAHIIPNNIPAIKPEIIRSVNLNYI